MAARYTSPHRKLLNTASRTVLVLSLILGTWLNNASAQVATSYSFTQTAGTFTAITGGTQLQNTTFFFIDLNPFNDQVSGAQTIPAFNFNGTVYTQMYVSANGFITFGSAPTGTNYTPLSSTETYAGAISAVGCNLHNTTNAITSTRDIRWQQVGSEIVVQWRGVRRLNVGSEGFAFQIRLNTATNAIRMVYGPFNQGPGSDVAIIPEVGLRGPNNTFATNVNNRLVGSGAENWGTSLAGTTNSSKARLTSTAPAKAWISGLTYTWTPCTAPAATFTVQNNCAAQQFSVDANVTSFGGGTSGVITYSVDNGAPSTQNVAALGTISVGPFPVSSSVQLSFSSNLTGCGSVNSGTLFSTCPVNITCGTTLPVYYCYKNNDTRTFTFTSSSPSATLTLGFVAGSIGANDVITFYDGTSNAGTVLTGNGYSNMTLTGLAITSISNSMFVEIASDGSNSCQDGLQTSWQMEVECTAGCVDPDGVVNVNTNCGAFNFNLDVEILSVGDASNGMTTLRYTVNGGSPVLIPGLTEFQVQNIGPFALADVVNVRLLHAESSSCDKNLGDYTRNQLCPPVNDLCANATTLTVRAPGQCPAQATAGTTFDGNLEIAAPTCGAGGAYKDVWYTFNTGWNTSPIQVNIVAGTMTNWGVELRTACGGTLISCASNSPASVSFSGFTVFTDYRIRVFTNTALGNPGTFSICLSATPLPTSCGTVIRDPGGTGNYSNNQNVTTTHCSGTAQSVMMTFTQFETQSGSDFVRVYDGPSTASTLLGTFSGSTIPGPFLSSHPTGCLTVNFTSNNFQTDEGYTADLTCCDTPMPTASASNNAPQCAGSTLQLTTTTNIGTVFSWTGPNGFTSTLQNPTIANVTSAAAGTYTVTVRNGLTGCPRTATTTVAISGTPGPINAGSNQTICASPGTATMAATAPTNGSGMWTQISGGPATITTPGSRTTTITGLTVAGSPYTFRWTVSNAPCTAGSDDMVVTVNATPTVANAGGAQTICSNGILALAANTPTIGTGSWSVVSGPSTSAGQFGNTAIPNTTFTPAAGAGTYTLRWTISNAPCTASTSNVVITVNAAPTGVTANSNAATVCAGSTVNLTANGATDATILAQNFNSGAGGWTTTNTSGGGTPANAAWTLRPNNYFYNASGGSDPTFSSNDASQFYLSNSDAQGSGGTTATTLVSPAFSTVGYSTVSLSFHHHYRFNSGTSDRAFVEVSTNGTTFNTLQTYSSTQGAVNGFVQATINLTSVAGQPTVYVRFRYTATFDWWWAVDNVAISGNGSGPLTWAWTSAPVGFTASVQNPSGVTVPENTTFTVVATAPNGCTATNSVAVSTVIPVDAGANGSNTVCSIDAPFSMFALLGGSAQTGGAWTGPSAVVGDNYDPATMDQGVYTYTVTGAAPCPNASSTVTVTETSATTWYADTDGDGFGSGTGTMACSAPFPGDVTDNSDLCPADPLKQNPGACGCGLADVPETYYADTDGDGFGAGSPVAGFTCIVPAGHVTNNTDLCATDPLKQDPGACGCGVADVAVNCYADPDGDGFGSGDPIPAFTCNIPSGHVTNNSDLCPLDPNKIDPGQCGCGNLDTDTDGDLTADCNDLCPNDPNKIAPGQCGCGNLDTDSDSDTVADCIDACPLDANNDQDGDGICGDVDSCPTFFGQNGDICDAQPGPGYTLGQITACACVPAVCVQNLTIEFQLDANPAEVGWELRQQGTNTLLQAGPPGTLMAANGIQTVNTCVPAGSYYLKVTDGGANGITNGGYVLRTAGPNGTRIIDNFRNFTSGSLSQIAGNQGFTVPAGINLTQGIYTSCDKLDWLPNGEYFACSPVTNVSNVWNAGNTPAEAISGYEFWIYNPNGGYSYRSFRSHAVSDGFAPDNAERACHMKINNWAAANQIPANVLMNVRVRSRINNVNYNWGPACRFKIDPVQAACPLTKLMDIPGNVYLSCGGTRTWGNGNYVHARPVSGATQYQFRFRIDAEGFLSVRTVSTYFVQLNWPTFPLQDGKTYDVEVRAYKGGVWCANNTNPTGSAPFVPWGDVCLLTIDNTPANGGNENMLGAGQSEQSEGLRMYPNPNRGDQLYLSLDAVEDGVQTVSVDIFDLTGKRLSARTIATQDGFINTTLDLNGEFANGMYIVNITAGDQHFTERLVISK
ncbi:MAG: T9SS type A sorting domain-containing protein [Flavobacteriales bacterium]